MNNQLDNNNQINNNYNQNNNMQNNNELNPTTQQFYQAVNQSSMSQQSINDNQINSNYNQNQSVNLQNNTGFNPATQQFQQVVNQASVSQQAINNNQMSNNFNQNNVISEKLKKHRKVLHNDSIILLIVSIVSIIAGLIFAGVGFNSGIDLFMESLFYVIFLIIIVESKNKIKKFIGILAIIVSSFMILFAIINHSLFDVMYFILAIFYIIHSIQYLKNIKGYVYVEEQKEKLKIDKLKNISLILIIMCAAYPIISIPLSFTGIYFFSRSISIVLFVFALTSLILNIILFVKKRKSAILYICSVFSVIITFFAGNYAINDIQKLLSHYTSYDTDEDKQYLMEKTESIINYDVKAYLGDYLNAPLPNSRDIVLISKEMYEEANRLGNEKLREKKKNPESAELYKDIEEKISIYEENEKQGYVCDGYTVVQRFYSQQECMDSINDSFDCRNYDEDYLKGEVYSKTFIKCSGKYEYQTEGFDEEKLNKSKNNKDEYINLGFKELEYYFNESVLEEFEWKLKFDDITSKIINKKDYENEIDGESVFEKVKYADYSCDGYVAISLAPTTNEFVGQPYINCNGKNKYQTEGFDNTKLLN